MSRPGYPKDMREFRQHFSDANACREYLVQCRWPEGFICPNCSGKDAWLNPKRYVFECKACGRQTSPTSGTVMHRSHLPLQEWFWAAYLVATHTPGISALQLQRHLGIGGYQNAWHLLHRLRKGMVNDARTRLSGPVEVDETYVGGREEGRSGGRHAGKKVIVAGAVEARGHGSGRVRLAVIKDVSAASLVSFVAASVERGSSIRSDAWKGYAALERCGFDHYPKTQGEGKNAEVNLPRIHRVFGNLKTWLNGTHHGVGAKHLPSYLDEYVFRFNRRRTPMAAFQTLLGISVHKTPTTLEKLMRPESK